MVLNQRMHNFSTHTNLPKDFHAEQKPGNGSLQGKSRSGDFGRMYRALKDAKFWSRCPKKMT
jgi:hypothetical protein